MRLTNKSSFLNYSRLGCLFKGRRGSLLIGRGSSLHIAIGIVMAALSLFLPMAGSAQTHYNSNVALGVKGGMDFSRVFFSPGVEQGFATGVTAGVTFRYIEENHFGLIAEANFAQMGWRENFEEVPYSYERTTNYITIPVLAHIYFGRRGRFFINAGPQIGFMLGDSYKANFDPFDTASLPGFPNTNRMNSQMTMDITQKVDYGICGGLGGEFSLNQRNALYIEARFYYGLGNLFPSNRADVFGASNSMSIQATIGYWFRIK